MIDTKPRVRAALEGAGVYLRPHQGDEYVGEVAMAVAVIYKHLSNLDTQNLQTWDISVLEWASIYGRAEGMARFTPDPKPEPPKLVKLDDSEALWMIRHRETPSGAHLDDFDDTGTAVLHWSNED